MEAGTATPVGGEAGGGLRPLDVGQTIDAAINLYRRNATKLWTLVAMVIIPIQILEVIIRRITLPSDVFLHSGTLYTHGSTSSSALTIGYLVVALLGLFGYLLATGAVFKLQLSAYLGEPHEIGESFEFVLERHRLVSLLWLGIITTVMVAVGFVLLIIPGIYLFVALSVAIPVLMLEGLRGMGAVSRSMSLVSGRWWPTFGRLLVGIILYIVAVFIVGAIAGAIAHGVSNVTVFLIINGIVGAIIAIFFAPFFAALINVIYIDLRVRKEGADSAMLMSGQTPTGPPPGVAPLPGAHAAAGEPPLEPPASEPPASAPPASGPPASAPPASEPPSSQPPPSEPPPSSAA